MNKPFIWIFRFPTPGDGPQSVDIYCCLRLSRLGRILPPSGCCFDDDDCMSTELVVVFIGIGIVVVSRMVGLPSL